LFFRSVVVWLFIVCVVFGFDTTKLNQSLNTKPSPVKLQNISNFFLNSPYIFSPLGEGKGIDTDTRFRIDKFDCTTFVETMLALTMSINIAQAKQNLDIIRYSGKVDFKYRRHLPALMWKPQLISFGLLEDITKNIKDFTTIIKKPNKKQLTNDMKFLSNFLETYSIDYIPLDKIEQNIPNIPNGSIVNVVRTNNNKKLMTITHQMLLFKKEGKIFFRHASSNPYKKVVDEDLKSFIKRVSKFKWKVVGINILKINYDK